MSGITDEFIAWMHSVGCGPARASDVKADDVRHDYQIQGDKPGVKKGRYRLKIDGDVAVAWCLNYRNADLVHKFSPKTPKNYTPEEKRDFKKKLEAEQAAAEKKVREEREDFQRKAKLYWDTLPIATSDHPYLTRKKIQPHGIRIDGDKLIIPMYRDGRIACIQTIWANGDKKFVFWEGDSIVSGASSHATHYPIASRDDDKSRILIVEGYATGASVREATGFPVIVAFSASGLLSAAEFYRRKYPDAQIILCCDNDQWRWDPALKIKHCEKGLVMDDIPGDDIRWKNWRRQGWLQNIGREKAEQAAAAIGGAYVIWPDFAEDDADKNSDFNDWAVIHGLDSVRDRILKIPEPEREPEVQAVTIAGHMNSENFWDIGMRIKSVDKTGTVVKYEENSLNYARIIEFHARLQGIFAWDEFHHSVIVRECPPWLVDTGREKEFKVHELDEVDVRECDYFIQGCQGQLRGSIEKTRGGIEDAAQKNKIHPARDYFNAQVWDGTPRLDAWLIDYVGCEKDDSDYVRAVGRTWIMGIVARVMTPGIKFDNMLILEGPQNAGKSTVLRIMSTFGDGPASASYFCDALNIRNCEDPDELMKTRGALIVEIQEMSGFNKKDDETLKAFITQQEDQYRAPYDRKTKKWPRQFLLSGTYNPVDGIFKDPTGLRRYWVVATGKRIDLEGLRRARQQIWAEAVARYKAGESLMLSAELYAKAEVAANERRLIDDMTHEVLSKARGLPWFETRDIMIAMSIPVRSNQQAEARNINRILTVEGFSRKQRKRDGRGVWGWEPAQLLAVAPSYHDEEELDLEDRSEVVI